MEVQLDLVEGISNADPAETDFAEAVGGDPGEATIDESTSP